MHCGTLGRVQGRRNSAEALGVLWRGLAGAGQLQNDAHPSCMLRVADLGDHLPRGEQIEPERAQRGGQNLLGHRDEIGGRRSAEASQASHEGRRPRRCRRFGRLDRRGQSHQGRRRQEKEEGGRHAGDDEGQGPAKGIPRLLARVRVIGHLPVPHGPSPSEREAGSHHNVALRNQRAFVGLALRVHGAFRPWDLACAIPREFWCGADHESARQVRWQGQGTRHLPPLPFDLGSQGSPHEVLRSDARLRVGVRPLLRVAELRHRKG
mmetsp:Transcript_123447/g.348804  ORF Transcript_123447/g.348804 Transcript_123447/m.348804 type:complete len:265 (-) Transcript_123447:638-1432(-)